jgi:HK97 family phage major capsid protein
MPASPLESLQFERDTLRTKAAALLQMDPQTGAPIASAAPPTAEDVKASQDILANQLPNLEARIKAMDDLRAALRTAPATREALVSTPRVEQDPKRGFESVGEFAKAVYNFGLPGGRGAYDERLAATFNDPGVPGGRFGAAAPTVIQQEGSSTDGFMVPPEYRPGIWRPAFETEDILSLVDPQPTSSNSVQIVTDEVTPWGGLGIVAYWLAEGSQKIPSKLITKGEIVKLHKVAALVYATDEVLQDAPILTTRINDWAPMAIAWTIGEAIIRGTGVGQPLGWENAGCLVTQPKETSQAAGTILPENVFKMESRLLAGAGARVGWLAHRETLPQIGMMKIGNEPSWTSRDGGMKDAPTGNLVGEPIRFSEHAQPLGTPGDLTLVNYAGYAAFIHSGGTRFDSSIHLLFDYDMTAFRWVIRLGGQPLLSAPIQPAKGSSTRSYFVNLAAR